MQTKCKNAIMRVLVALMKGGYDLSSVSSLKLAVETQEWEAADALVQSMITDMYYQGIFEGEDDITDAFAAAADGSAECSEHPVAGTTTAGFKSYL